MKSAKELMEEDSLFGLSMSLQYAIDVYKATIKKYPIIEQDEAVLKAVQTLESASEIVWSMQNENNKNIVPD